MFVYLASGLSHGLIPFLEGCASAVQRWLLVILCLVSAIASYVSSPPSCWALHCHWCHCFLCLVSITSHAVVCSCACHHHRCHRLIRFIAITPCTSSPSPRAPHHHHPVPLVAVTLRPSSPSPCSPRHQHPAPLTPSPSVAFGPCTSLATLVPVLVVF